VNIDDLQLVVLAAIQGLTEFLPVSSSAHLLLPRMLLGWPDQGVAFDVAVHLGTLTAVVVYLREELLALLRGCRQFVETRQSNEQLRLVLCLLIATLPLLPAGLLVAPHLEELRAIEVVAATTIVYALLLWWADRRGGQARQLASLSYGAALLIGLAQTLALVPGTSRSGITMTAALFAGLDRVAAAKFSFLLAIPAIVASALHQLIKLAALPAVPWLQLLAAAVIFAVVALLSMHALIGWLRRAGMAPFVVYRLVLGGVLLLMAWV